MNTGSKRASTVVPCLRYHDAPRAIEWLKNVAGFETHLVVPNDDGTIAHAELTLGGGMIMLGSAPSIEFGSLLKHPDDVAGKVTQTAYVIVDDADEVYRRVQEHGGKIEIAIKDEDYGGRGFTCRDLEGNVWTFGTYDPWTQA